MEFPLELSFPLLEPPRAVDKPEQPGQVAISLSEDPDQMRDGGEREALGPTSRDLCSIGGGIPEVECEHNKYDGHVDNRNIQWHCGASMALWGWLPSFLLYLFMAGGGASQSRLPHQSRFPHARFLHLVRLYFTGSRVEKKSVEHRIATLRACLGHPHPHVATHIVPQVHATLKPTQHLHGCCTFVRGRM